MRKLAYMMKDLETSIWLGNSFCLPYTTQSQEKLGVLVEEGGKGMTRA